MTTTTRARPAHTVDSLMTMFYDGARQRDAVFTVPQGQSFTLTAKQFAWLRDVAQREDGFTARGRAGRAHVQGEIAGVGGFEANEQKYGSATVIVRS